MVAAVCVVIVAIHYSNNRHNQLEACSLIWAEKEFMNAFHLFAGARAVGLLEYPG